MMGTRWTVLLNGAYQDVFERWGILDATPTEVINGSIGFDGAAAFIGFAGAQLKGTLVIVAPMTMLREASALTQPSQPRSDNDLEDWLGEMANQLLGSIKGYLLPFGHSFQLSTPSTLRGVYLRLTNKEEDAQNLLLFKWRGAEFMVYFCASGASEDMLAEPPQPQEGQAHMGDVLLF